LQIPPYLNLTYEVPFIVNAAPVVMEVKDVVRAVSVEAIVRVLEPESSVNPLVVV
jgi:hypothetical protein